MGKTCYSWLYPQAASNQEAYHLYLAESHRCARLARMALKTAKVREGIETPEATFLDLFVAEELRQRGLPPHLELVLVRRNGNKLLDAMEDIHCSRRWSSLRSAYMAAADKKCCKCGSVEDLQVDHIQPVSKFPEKALDWDNLQILCGECNRHKSNTHSTDYRYGDARPKYSREKKRHGLRPTTVANRFRTLMLMLGLKPSRGINQRHRKILSAMPHEDMVVVFDTVKMLIEEQRRSIEKGGDCAFHSYLRGTIDWEKAPQAALDYAKRHR